MLIIGMQVDVTHPCSNFVMSMIKCFFFFFLILNVHTNVHLTVQRTTYSENEVLCKDTVGSHRSSTTSTEGYFWNVIRGKKKTNLTYNLERETYLCALWLSLWNQNTTYLLTPPIL